MLRPVEQSVRTRGEIVNSIGELIKWLDGYGRTFRTAKGGTWFIGKPIRKIIYTPYDFSVTDLENIERALHDTQTDICLGLTTPVKVQLMPFQPGGTRRYKIGKSNKKLSYGSWTGGARWDLNRMTPLTPAEEAGIRKAYKIRKSYNMLWSTRG